MSYTLNHTAEQIDHKLNLIDRNKNLLPYPYNTDFPAELADVGDGSILISATNIPTLSENILLNTCSLPAGKKYIISLSVTNLVNEVSVQDHEVRLVVAITGKDLITLTKDTAYEILDLSSETEPVTMEVYIGNGTPTVNADSLIKPQIEEAQELESGELQTSPTAWVPYMDKIGNYVDERFNGTNAKIKVITDAITAHTARTDNPHAVTLDQLKLKTETWTFELDDDTTVTKSVVVFE